VPYSLEFIISPASPTTMRAISTCAVNEGRGTKQATIHKRRTANEELEQQSRGAQGVCCRPCLQIATKSSTNHQQQRRPRAPPRASSSRVVASSRSSSREPLLFVSLCAHLHISPSSGVSLVVVAGGDCPTHIDIVFLLPITQTPLCVGLDTLSLLGCAVDCSSAVEIDTHPRNCGVP